MAAPTDPATGAPVRLPAWAAMGERDFRLFWVGAVVSNTGTWMQRVTIPYVLYQATGSATWVGFTAFVQFLPVVVLGPVGGSLADRYPRRSLLLALQAIAAVLAGVLWLLWEADRATPGVITAVVAVLGVSFALTGPAWQAFVSELVPRPLLLNAVTLNSLQFNASRATGPALAGVVIAAFGPGAAFLVNALSYAAVLVALALIRAGRRPALTSSTRARPFREAVETFAYVRRRPGIVAAFVTVAALGLCGGPVADLVVVFAEDVFDVGGAAYGLLVAALGVGAVLGAPLVAGRGSGVRRSVLLRVSGLAYGLSMVAFACAPSYAAAVAALLVGGAGYLTIASTLNTAIQVQVADDRRGKVLAQYLMVFTLAIPVGALVQGALVDAIGPRVTVAGAGVLFTGAVAVLSFGTGLTARLDDDATAGT